MTRRSLLPWSPRRAGLLARLRAHDRRSPSIELDTMEAPVARALTRAREAVLQGRRSSEAWGELGATYHAHRLFDEAVLCYEQAIELDAGRLPLGLLRGHRPRGEPAPGRRRPSSASRRRPSCFPDTRRLYVRLGAAISQRGLLDEARQAYTHALQLDPGFAVAHRGLGQLLLAAGDAETAAEHLAQAVQLNPEDGAAYAALAQARLRLGQPFLARRDAERARGTSVPKATIPDPLFEAEVASRSVSSLRALTRAVRPDRRRKVRGGARGAGDCARERAPGTPRCITGSA